MPSAKLYDIRVIDEARHGVDRRRLRPVGRRRIPGHLRLDAGVQERPHSFQEAVQGSIPRSSRAAHSRPRAREPARSITKPTSARATSRGQRRCKSCRARRVPVPGKVAGGTRKEHGRPESRSGFRLQGTTAPNSDDVHTKDRSRPVAARVAEASSRAVLVRNGSRTQLHARHADIRSQLSGRSSVGRARGSLDRSKGNVPQSSADEGGFKISGTRTVTTGPYASSFTPERLVRRPVASITDAPSGACPQDATRSGGRRRFVRASSSARRRTGAM